MSSINFFCDLAEATTPLPHFWEHTVGSDHALMGRAQIGNSCAAPDFTAAG